MRQLETLLHDGDQHVGGDRDPCLCLHRVLAGAEKCLDAQVLLDPFEEELDLPTLPVQLRDKFRLQREVVRQEGHSVAGLWIDDVVAAH